MPTALRAGRPAKRRGKRVPPSLEADSGRPASRAPRSASARAASSFRVELADDHRLESLDSPGIARPASAEQASIADRAASA